MDLGGWEPGRPRNPGNRRSPDRLPPPGYPAFVALVLRALTPVPRALDDAYLARSRPALYVVHSVVLGLAAGAWVLALAPRVGPTIAAATAVAQGANPFALAAVGLTHYTLLHMALLVFGGWGLARALEKGRPGPLMAAGMLWGAITLVRPTSLALPLVLPLVLRAAGSAVRRPLRTSLWVSMGLLLAVVPWTARNAAIRHRFVPVNAQTWTALWAATVKPLPIRPECLQLVRASRPLPACLRSGDGWATTHLVEPVLP